MILIFDCFGTIIDFKSVDFNKGLTKLYEDHFKDSCSFEELEAYNLELFHHVEDLHAQEKEMAFVREELPLYIKKFGAKPFTMTPSDEVDFMTLCTELDNIEGIPEALSEFVKKGINCYVLSNSIYSSEALKELVDRFGIGRYFSNVWASSDYGVVKPSKEFFDMAIEKILAENPGETKDTLIYVGDTYESDVCGADRAGIGSVWINRKNEEDVKGIATAMINNATQLLDAVNKLAGGSL